MQTLRFEHTIKDLNIQAIDGNIGTCVDLLFDERYWTARYLVVKTGSWLLGRKVLIPIVSVDDVDLNGRSVNVCLTREQIEQSPPIDADAPVSRQKEKKLFDYYAFAYYWHGGIWGNGLYPAALRQPTGEDFRASQPAEPDPHLRSLVEIIGYDLQADGDVFARVKDVHVNPPIWTLTNIIASPNTWFSNREYFLKPEWIRAVSWDNKALTTRPSDRRFNHAPESESAASSAAMEKRELHGRNLQRERALPENQRYGERTRNFVKAS